MPFYFIFIGMMSVGAPLTVTEESVKVLILEFFHGTVCHNTLYQWYDTNIVQYWENYH